MPVIFKENINDVQVAAWKVTETLTELSGRIELSPDEQVKFRSFHHDKRRSEFLAARALLQEVGCAEEVRYSNSGKPFFLTDTHVSISHSHGMVMIGISNDRIGVDVELMRDKIVRIQHKFLHDSELEWSNNVTELTRIWAAKESVFKCYSDLLFLEFKEDIEWEGRPFEPGESSSRSTVKVHKGEFNKRLELVDFRIGEHIFTYSLNG